MQQKKWMRLCVSDPIAPWFKDWLRGLGLDWFPTEKFLNQKK